MTSQYLCDCSLHLISHVYWERKDRFRFRTDTYPVWVVFAVESGSFQYQIGVERGIAEKSELVFCPPGYSFQREMLSPMSLHFIGFEFDKKPTLDIPVLMPSFKSQPADEKRLASDFAYLRKLHLATDTRNMLLKQWILNDIWQLACNEWDNSSHQDELTKLTNSDDELMNRAAEWLFNKAHTQFSMRELSEMLELSPVQFTRRFRKAFHITPSELVRTLRIRKAAKLLLDTDLTLDQIAKRCGYDNGFYLSRVFSRHMNVSPSKYRQQNRV
ncbi:helix-turn-helix domain-containing protein [Novibacillus thermophilus]|uniref:helix-turn-helix domain-containing protein n=1 Tax=Novibacillus thermophilus TaxID=1471761 RepID=UPI00098BC987|nr:AraC family transcriptional regulator [Novibacillus thermophilus]